MPELATDLVMKCSECGVDLKGTALLMENDGTERIVNLDRMTADVQGILAGDEASGMCGKCIALTTGLKARRIL